MELIFLPLQLLIVLTPLYFAGELGIYYLEKRKKRKQQKEQKKS